MFQRTCHVSFRRVKDATGQLQTLQMTGQVSIGRPGQYRCVCVCVCGPPVPFDIQKSSGRKKVKTRFPGEERVYMGTSLIRNTHPPRITTGP